MPVQSVYGQHWSITGSGIPASDAPDRDVYLPGRNVLLLSLVGTWCSLQGIHTMAIGSLSLNPFPDGTPEFFEKFSAAVGMGLGHELRVLAPYRGRSKADLIREFRDLPLELTLTCMNPVSGHPAGGATNARNVARRSRQPACSHVRQNVGIYGDTPTFWGTWLQKQKALAI